MSDPRGILVRRPLADSTSERGFVAKSWVESFANSTVAEGLTFAGLRSRSPSWEAGPAYWRTWNALVNQLMARGRVTVADDDGLVAGFVAWEPWDEATALHYVYVRLSYRGRGVARELLETLPAGPLVFTHRSRSVRHVPPSWRYTMAPLFGVSERRAA